MKSKEIIKTCHWEITKRCNLNCLHCISSVGSKQELDRKSALRIIDILKDWGCKEIYFTGGEPLIRQDIFSIFKKIKENKMKVGLLSNGTLINNKNIKQIKNYVDEIGISLDGASIETNDVIRSSKSFKKTIKAINYIKKQKIPITLHVTICKLNINDFENILKLAKSLKIKSIRVNEITLRGKAFKNKKILALDKYTKHSLTSYLLDAAQNVNDKNKTRISFGDSCDVDRDNIFISSRGRVYPCVEVYQKNPSQYLVNILDTNKQKFDLKQKNFLKLKPPKCPYQFIVKNNLTLCLNNPSIKCDYEYQNN